MRLAGPPIRETGGGASPPSVPGRLPGAAPSQLTERGIPPVAVSPQKPDGSLTMQQKHGLGFTVVSDPGNDIAGRLGILTRPSPDARPAQLQLGLDLAGVNADGTATLPMPATVILDAGRTVRWIGVHPDALQPRDLIRYASDLGLDGERFAERLRKRAGAARIAEDVDTADLSDVTGTPTFFINGRRHYGSYDIT